MNELLYIDGQIVDLIPNQITRKLQISSVNEIMQRKSSFSYTIKLPKTSRNKKIFKMLGTIGSFSDMPYMKASAEYMIDNVRLIENGIAIVKKTSEHYQVNLIDGFKSLADLIGSSKINELPLAELNHILTTDFFIDTWTNKSGLIYAFSDYGQGLQIGINKQVYYYAPSIFSHTIFERILKNVGVSLQGDFFNNTKYLNEVVTLSKGYDIADSTATTTSKGGANSDTLTENYTSGQFVEIDEKFTLTDNSLIGASIVSGNIEFSVAGRYRLDFATSYSTLVNYLSIKIVLDGQTVSIIDLIQGSSLTDNTEIIIDVVNGSTLEVYLIGSTSNRPDFDVNYTIDTDISLNLISDGMFVNPTLYFDDIKQIDFVKEIANRYGLIIQPVKNSNNYEFIQIQDLLEDFDNAEDWTNKVALINDESYNSNYSKINYAKNKYDESYAIKKYEGEMSLDNENLTEEKTLFESVFEIPYLKWQFQNSKYLIPIWGYDDESNLINLETPIKIMNLLITDAFVEETLGAFGGSSSQTFEFDVPYLDLTNMSLQYNIDNYYSNFADMVDNYKELSLNMNLTVFDIYKNDFFKLKFLKQTGRFYYLDFIQYAKGKLSKVNLIEVRKV